MPIVTLLFRLFSYVYAPFYKRKVGRLNAAPCRGHNKVFLDKAEILTRLNLTYGPHTLEVSVDTIITTSIFAVFI